MGNVGERLRLFGHIAPILFLLLFQGSKRVLQRLQLGLRLIFQLILVDIALIQHLSAVFHPRKEDDDVDKGDEGAAQGGHEKDDEDQEDVVREVDEDAALLHGAEVEALVLQLPLLFLDQVGGPDLVVLQLEPVDQHVVQVPLIVRRVVVVVPVLLAVLFVFVLLFFFFSFVV